MSVIFFFLFCFILPLKGFIRSIYTHNKLRITMLNQEKIINMQKNITIFIKNIKAKPMYYRVPMI